MEAALAEARVVYCEEEDCGSLVKPDIVFFGESVSSMTSTPLSGQTLSLYWPRLTPFAYHTHGSYTLSHIHQPDFGLPCASATERVWGCRSICEDGWTCNSHGHVIASPTI